MAFILVVEPEPVLRGLIGRTLRLDGHKIIESSDAVEALRAGRKRGDVIDIILTDVEVGTMSGAQLVQHLIHDGLNIPALFMSGYPDVSRVIASIIGSDSVIEKPFGAIALRQAVNNFLTKRSPQPTTAFDAILAA